jgi:hypothetical protein
MPALGAAGTALWRPCSRSGSLADCNGWQPAWRRLAHFCCLAWRRHLLVDFSDGCRHCVAGFDDLVLFLVMVPALCSRLATCTAAPLPCHGVQMALIRLPCAGRSSEWPAHQIGGETPCPSRMARICPLGNVCGQYLAARVQQCSKQRPISCSLLPESREQSSRIHDGSSAMGPEQCCQRAAQLALLRRAAAAA